MISQKKIGELACGPCAVAHSRGKDDTEAKDIIIDMISTPSVKFDGKRRAYTSEDGTFAEDLVAIIKKRYETNVTMQFLNRQNLPDNSETDKKETETDENTKETEPDENTETDKKEETGLELLRRVHNLLLQALKKDYKPIVEIRSFVVEPEKWDFKWFCTLGHFNVISWVPEVLEENQLGFNVKFIDSLTGKEEFGYVYFEKYRNYTATRDFKVDALGKIDWEWVTDFPYLCVITPNIQLNTEKHPYQARTVTVLRVLIS